MRLASSSSGLRGRARAALSTAVMLTCLLSALPTDAQETEDTPVVSTLSPEWPMGPVGGYRQWRTMAIAAERLRRFPLSANTIAWLVSAHRIEDAFGVLQRIIEARPEAIGEAFRSNDWHDVQVDRTKGYADRLRALVKRAHEQLLTLDRDAQSRAALAMMNVEIILLPSRSSNDSERQLREIVAAFPGTTGAALARVGLVELPRPSPESLEEYDTIAVESPGTEMAAMALYLKAFRLAFSPRLVDPGGQSGDSTERFLEVLRIATELEQSPFASSPWVGDLTGLVLQFRHSTGKMSSENRARLLQACREYALDHVTLLEDPRRGPSLERWIGVTMPIRAAQDGDAGAADRWFDDLTRLAPDRAPIAFLRAQWLVRAEAWEGAPAARPGDAAEARRLLTELAAGQGVLARRALVMLATHSLSSGDLPAAHTLFAEYYRRFADVPEAWMAGLRVAQVDHQLGNFDVAARGFSEVASRHAALPFARVLGAVYAGRSHEAGRRFDEARELYAEALGAWMPPIYDWLSAGWPSERGAMGPFTIRRPDVTRRLAELVRVLPMPEGQQLARAQWLLAENHPSDARLVVAQVIASGPGAASTAEARRILHRAQLDEAVMLASAEASSPNIGEALRSLDTLTREAFDPAVALAGVVQATLLMLDGQRAAGDVAMGAALKSWNAHESPLPAPGPGSLAEDMLAIRDAVFQPLGGPQLDGRWNAYDWPTAPPRFMIAPRTLQAKEPGHALPTDVPVSRQPAGLTNVLFVDLDQVEYLTTIVTKFGGTKRREPTDIMEVPNQPIGGARAILRWWNGFFPTRPGHWGGVEMLTYPAFTSVEFTDAARTRALVPIRVGYAGATVVLEKADGKWTIKELVNFWIT